MYWPGHVGFALAAGAVGVTVVGGRRSVAGAALLVLLATAPDVDLAIAAIPHRGPTHTVWAALGLGSTLAVAGGTLSPRHGTRTDDHGSQWGTWWGTATLGFVLGGSSVLVHLLGDALTPMGIRPLAPLVPTTYTLDLVAARNPAANHALLLAGVLLFGFALARRRYTRLRGPRPVRGVDHG